MKTRLPVDPLPPLASGLVVLAAASPWLLGFSASHAAVANGIAFAMAFAPLALMIAALPAAAAVCGGGGLWLAASPWALGYGSSGVAAWGADLILGAALVRIAWRRRTLVSPSTTLRRNER
jgi:SPW repeat-containing protein